MSSIVGRPGFLACLLLMSAAAWSDEFPAPTELPSRLELPDPLVSLDGTPVTTREQWVNERRPELLRLFQHYMYGVTPPAPQISARITQDFSPILGGKARLREVEIRFSNLPESAPRIRLALFLPASVKDRPCPIFLGLNKCGNEEVVVDDAVSIDPEAWRHKNCSAEGRGASADFWCVDYLVSRGYGLATFHESDIDPDQHDFTDGIHAAYPDLNAPPEARWGTIAAWAWGLQRAVDYLVTDPLVDARRIAVIGHSRRGKTALLAGALDERIALVVPHQSGTGGMALSRDSQQETVERINRVFPHWFNDNFTKFDSQVERLPFDQHCLVACVAPRPVFDTEGAKDAWANFPRSLDSLKAATAVYELLGVPGVVGDGLVTAETAITPNTVGNLVQCRLEHEHTLNRDFWARILDYAEVKLVDR